MNPYTRPKAMRPYFDAAFAISCSILAIRAASRSFSCWGTVGSLTVRLADAKYVRKVGRRRSIGMDAAETTCMISTLSWSAV